MKISLESGHDFDGGGMTPNEAVHRALEVCRELRVVNARLAMENQVFRAFFGCDSDLKHRTKVMRLLVRIARWYAPWETMARRKRAQDPTGGWR